MAAFGPYEEIDPAFGEALRAAAQAGVEVYAFKIDVSRGGTGGTNCEERSS